MAAFGFTILHKDRKSKARIGRLATAHGTIQTPAFVPVGTQATVKSLTPEELKTIGVGLYFVNTYHMYLRPGIEVVKKMGGLHTFMNWDKPLMTDSGGFQVFSLGRSDLVKISEQGVEFRSHWDGSRHLFTPETSMKWQEELGSDIHIAFDDCTPYPVTHEKARISLDRTHRWAVRSLKAHRKGALYGSVQGSVYQDLREESAKYIGKMDFDGVAIGGVSVGESKRQMRDVIRWVVPHLPEGKPRHLLGVGEFDDIFALVEAGIDTFDCVQPTRLARMGHVYVGRGAINITNAKYAKDKKPIDKCDCYSCRHFTRAYINHLFRVRELLAYRLATIHNLHVVHKLVAAIRSAIARDQFLELARKWR